MKYNFKVGPILVSKINNLEIYTLSFPRALFLIPFTQSPLKIKIKLTVSFLFWKTVGTLKEK